MYFFAENFNSNGIYCSAGFFVSNTPWIHTNRKIDSYELILGVEGILPISVNGKNFNVGKGDVLLIPPNIVHEGYKFTNGVVKFLWIHFFYEALNIVEEADISRIIEEDIVLLPSYCYLDNINRLHLMTKQLLDLYEEKVTYTYMNNYLNSILQEVSYQTIKNIKNNILNSCKMQPIQDWIRVHAYENISLDNIAEYFNYNKNYLSRKYKEVIGIGVMDQIIKYRIDNAKLLLSDLDLSICEISNAVGYNDPKYFMRIFRKVENMTPTEYRYTFNKRHYNME